MNSFNDIQKIKYTSNVDSYVDLKEYIIFSDDKAQNKYVVFKFKNNLTQYLFGFRCEISLFDDKDQLLEKITFDQTSIKVNGEEEYVPEAKLSIDYRSKYLSFKLIEAYFERIHFDNGVIKENPLTFEEYKNSKVGALEVPVKKVEPNDFIKNRQKKINANFLGDYNYVSRLNITRRIAPIVLTTILGLGVVGYSVYATISQKFSQTYITINGNDYNLQSNNTVTLKSYEGGKDVYLTSKVGNYTLTGIAPDAFKNNTKIETLTIAISGDTKFTIGSSAFNGCSNLKTVYSNEASLSILSNAFANCPNLTMFIAPTTDLNTEKIFYNDTSLSTLSYNESSLTNLYKVFTNSDSKFYIPTTLNSISTNMSYIPSNYFVGVNESSTYISYPATTVRDDDGYDTNLIEYDTDKNIKLVPNYLKYVIIPSGATGILDDVYLNSYSTCTSFCLNNSSIILNNIFTNRFTRIQNLDLESSIKMNNFKGSFASSKSSIRNITITSKDNISTLNYISDLFYYTSSQANNSALSNYVSKITLKGVSVSDFPTNYFKGLESKIVIE